MVSKTVWGMLQPVSSRMLFLAVYAALIVSLSVFTSCGTGLSLRGGYRGLMVELRDGGGGGYRGGRPMMGGRNAGYPMPHLTAGQRLGLEVFGNQPKHPTPGARRTSWASVFGPRGPMINDKGRYALVEHVPVGLMVKHDPRGPWTWKADCNNRLLNVPRQQPRPQVVQRPYQQRIDYYCPPPQRQRMMVLPCPPPPCPPPNLHFQRWGPPSHGGYRGGYGGGYQQRRMW